MSYQNFKDLLVIYLTAIVYSIVMTHNVHPSARLIRGQIVTIDKAPFTLQIRDQYNMFKCGGTLVTSRYMVTAAHCVERKSLGNIIIIGGASKSYEDGLRRNVVKVIMHPDFNSETGNFDVAVLKLDSELTGPLVDTLPLCSRSMGHMEFMDVYGWGWTKKEFRASDDLRWISAPVWAQQYCMGFYRNYYMKITDAMMCAGAVVTDTCVCDSGGPAVYQGELCGIVSWGEGCGSPNYPGVYTRIDVVRGFIEKCLQEDVELLRT